jgi:hypothetical protein
VNESSVRAGSRDCVSLDELNVLTTPIVFSTDDVGGETVIDDISIVTVFFVSRACNFLINDK